MISGTPDTDRMKPERRNGGCWKTQGLPRGSAYLELSIPCSFCCRNRVFRADSPASLSSPRAAGKMTLRNQKNSKTEKKKRRAGRPWGSCARSMASILHLAFRIAHVHPRLFFIHGKQQRFTLLSHYRVLRSGKGYAIHGRLGRSQNRCLLP